MPVVPADAEVVDVTRFGAVGDGHANDARAVLGDALFVDFDGYRTVEPRFDPNRPVVLYLPEGTYRLGALDGFDRRPSFPFSRFEIRGDGPGRTTVLLDHVEYPLVRLSVHADHRFGDGVDVAIRDLTVASTLPRPGDRSSAEMNIHLRDLRGFEIDNVEVRHGPRIAFHVNSCASGTFRNCWVHDMNTDGIHLVGCRDILVEDNVVQDTGDDGIAVLGGNWWNPDLSADVVIRRNRVERTGSAGISMVGCEHVLVEDNDVTGTYLGGIVVRPFWDFAGVRDVTIRKNRIQDAGLHETGILWGGGIASGLAVANDLAVDVDVDGVLIEENVVGACRNSFLRVRGARNVTVRGNEFVGPLVPGPSANQGSGEGSASCDPGVYDPVHVVDSTGVVIDDPGWRK